MANVIISDMTRTTSVGGSDLIPIVQGGQSKSIEYKNINKYSTTEQVVGTWTNGKPLYRKTVTGTTTASSTEYTIQKSSISADLEDYCLIQGIVKTPNSQMWHNVPYYKEATDFANYFTGSGSGNLILQSGTIYGFGNFIMQVYYTKTTDSAS